MVEPKVTGTEAHKTIMPLHFTHFSLSAFSRGFFFLSPDPFGTEKSIDNDSINR